jgi:hypothetical protein
MYLGKIYLPTHSCAANWCISIRVFLYIYEKWVLNKPALYDSKNKNLNKTCKTSPIFSEISISCDFAGRKLRHQRSKWQFCIWIIVIDISIQGCQSMTFLSNVLYFLITWSNKGPILQCNIQQKTENICKSQHKTIQIPIIY